MFNQYILILIWIGLMVLFQGSNYREEYCEISGQYEWKVQPLFAFVVFIPIIWMATNRGWLADTYTYIKLYRGMPDSFSGIPAYMATTTKDKGFYFFSSVLRSIFGYEHESYLFVVALIQGIALIYLYRKYSTDYVFPIFLFVASTDYISWMFNGMRQFMAVTIMLFATPYMLEKKYIRTIAIILLASTFHQSALLMLPIVIIAQGEAWNKKTLFFMGGTILAVAFVGQFTGMMDDALQSTNYANVVSDYTLAGDDGTNPLRVLVYSVPALLSFYGRKQIREYGGILINFCANMSIVSMGLYLVSMVTSGVFIGRLPIYASLYSYILLPWEIENLFGGSNKSVKMLCVGAYLLFYYYQMHFAFGLF